MKLKIDNETNPALKPLYSLDLRFESSGSNQATARCPLCDAPKKHFYINRKNGLWDCKQCASEGGNIEQFLSRYVRRLFDETTAEDYKPLIKATGLPAQVFRKWSIAWDSEHDQFLLPVRKDKEAVYNLVRFDSSGKFIGGLWGLGTQLYGEYKAKAKEVKTIIIAEGHKDCWALSWLYRHKPEVAVVGAPGAGANLIKYAWLFRHKHIILCYDHDKAGRKGTQSALNFLFNTEASSIKIFAWPKSISFKERHGYDITDYYKDLKKKYKFNLQRLNRIEKYFKPWDKIKWLSEIETTEWVLPRRKLSDIEEKEIDWLWPHWIAKGFVNLMVAVPGMGKSTLIQKFIADITSKHKRTWPHSSIAIPKGTAILCSAEEAIAQTIRPRQRKFGGNADKIEIPPDVENKTTGERVPFNILEHRHLLEKLIEEMPDLQIIVFDPAVEYISMKTDINVEMQIREILRILQDIAEKYQIAIVAIAHVNKNTSQYFLQRILGAQAWGARVRIVLGIAEHPEYPNDNTRKVLVLCKTSLGPERSAIGFRIIEDTDGLAKLTFDKLPVNLIKSEIFTPTQQKKSVGRPPRARERAETFLKKMLADGPIPPNIIIKFGGKQDITESTIKRAAKKLKIKTKYITKGEYKGQDCWVLKSEKKRVLKVKKKKRKN